MMTARISLEGDTGALASAMSVGGPPCLRRYLTCSLLRVLCLYRVSYLCAVCLVLYVCHIRAVASGNCCGGIAHMCGEGMGPGDETIVLRIVDGILLPHLCGSQALSRALNRQEIFHLGGGDSTDATQAVRDYYLHWLKRLMTTEGEGVLPLSIAVWTHQHATIHMLTRPLKSAYLPLPRDFLFLPLAIALKAVNQKADAHLATPEFQRASSMALSLVLVLLQQSTNPACATAWNLSAGVGEGLGALLVGRGRMGGAHVRGVLGGAGEALFCKTASVYLLGSDVYLHDSVAVFVRSALTTMLPPSWKCISSGDGGSSCNGGGGDACVAGAAVGLDLSQKCAADLQVGKLFAALASQFTQDSFGDVSLSQILLFALQPRLPSEWRIEVCAACVNAPAPLAACMRLFVCEYTHTKTHTHAHTHNPLQHTDLGNTQAILPKPAALRQRGPRRRHALISVAP
jgi:hypothetical protein